ncbi:hypothetical protein [Caproiciproducens sp. LBM24188]|nr:hypothetical protein [Oscillospiraceae bacterium]HHV30893.1 hypothetical protein [Clostridiales bacterium]
MFGWREAYLTTSPDAFYRAVHLLEGRSIPYRTKIQSGSPCSPSGRVPFLSRYHANRSPVYSILVKQELLEEVKGIL